MKIPVAGMDPSLTHWGIAEAQLDLVTGILETPKLTLMEPLRITQKQVRQNSMDLHEAEQLAQVALKVARRSKIIFVEVPVGSQSARAMASYGVCVGILGAIRSEGIQLIEVTAIETKLALAGIKTATKADMIKAARDFYPDANFPTKNGKIVAKAEHVADAIGTIHAGVRTPVFKNFLRLFEEV